MSYSIYDNTMNTVTVTGPTPAPVYTTTTTTTNTGGISPGLYWGMNGTSAGSGQVLTSNGTGGSIWADPNLNGSTLKVKGNAEFEGEVSIKGKNISDMFAKIEDRLAILHPNEKLEEKWEELRNLRKAYMELEAEIIEKEKIWKILKD